MVREDTWYDFSFLKFTEAWFVTQDVVCPEEYSMCPWAESIFFCIWWKVLKISVRSIWSNVSFTVCVSLWILCFDDLSISVSGMLRSATLTVLLLIFPLMPVSVFLIYILRCSYVGCINIYNFMSSSWINPLNIGVVSFLISHNILYFKVYFAWNNDCHSGFL